MPSPDSPYLVCATPRSGSTLLCELLTTTGVAGRPQEYFEHLYATNQPRQAREYFEGVTDPDVIDRLRPTDAGTPESAEAFEERLSAALREGTTPNGVWASKLMWGYFLDFLRRLHERPDTADRKPAEAVEHLFPGVRYVHVKRRDKLAQAISLWTAVQTLAWRDDGDDDSGAHEPVYSYAGIEHLREQLTGQDEAWTRWFAAAGVEPVVIAYEDLVADQRGVVLDLLRTLHIDTFGVDVPEPKMRRQSGGRSAEWAERFEADRKEAVA